MARYKGIKGVKPHMWTDEEKEYLKEIVKGHTYNELKELMSKKFKFDYTINQIKGALNRYKLNTGLTGRFKKGNVPANKGKKGLTGANKGSFYKGQPPINFREVGSERVTKDGYTEVKVKNPDVWRLKHSVIWEKEYGPVPKGYAIMFADGNKQNFNIDNLLLVTKAQLAIMVMRKLRKDDIELTKIGLNIAKVYEKISEIKKEAKR